MNKAKRTSFLLVLLATLLLVSLGAASVEATYIEELDTTIYNSSHFGIQSAGYPVALHVGTLTINEVGSGSPPYLFSLRLDRSGDFGGGDEYKLESTKEINNQDEFGAQLVAKVHLGGNRTRVTKINWGTGEDPLLQDFDLFYVEYPFVIDFYLGIRNIRNAGQAVGAGFQFEDDDGPNLGNFNLIYRSNAWWDYQDISIPIGGSTSPKPFFGINYNEDSRNFLNGNMLDTTVYVSLAVEQTPAEKSINLLDATGLSRAKVGQARLTLTGYERPSVPGVTITFTDGNASPNNNFRLRHATLPSFIPFSLYLAGVKVDNGVPITWNNLAYGSNNLKALHVGNIEDGGVSLKMSGSYSDTITVNITPLDTNLIGL